MRRAWLAAVVLLLVAGAFFVGRLTSPEKGEAAIVTAAARADAVGGTQGCRDYMSTNEIYLVRWTVKGIQSGICVKPDSDCARKAYVGGTVPKTCRDQGE